MSKSYLLPLSLFLLGILMLLGGGVQALAPSLLAHRPAAKDALTMLKTVPLYGHIEHVAWADPASIQRSLNTNTELDGASVTFLARESPANVLGYYDTWTSPAGWIERGYHDVHSPGREYKKGKTVTTGYALTEPGSGWFGLGQLQAQTDFLSDYILAVGASSRVCSVYGDRAANIEGITTVTLSLVRLK